LWQIAADRQMLTLCFVAFCTFLLPPQLLLIVSLEAGML
jgi:hypothetical protein